MKGTQLAFNLLDTDSFNDGKGERCMNNSGSENFKNGASLKQQIIHRAHYTVQSVTGFAVKKIEGDSLGEQQ